MEAILGEVACDKCGQKMKKGEAAIIVAEGLITKSAADELHWDNNGIRYACHLKCWDGHEEIEG